MRRPVLHHLHAGLKYDYPKLIRSTTDYLVKMPMGVLFIYPDELRQHNVIQLGWSTYKNETLNEVQ